MTVYVDDMYKYKMGEFKRGGRAYKMSHMIATTEQELHDFAALLGLKKKWFQKDHYDVTMTVREKAIALGAVPLTIKQLSCMCVVRRITGFLPSPGIAIKSWQTLYEKFGHVNS